MPGRDGSGPMGQGSLSGRGQGICTGVNAARYRPGLVQDRGAGRLFGAGFFCRRGSGFHRKMNIASISKETKKEILVEQKEILQKELDLINQQLETSKDS